MKKPKRLQPGDTIATISLSSGLGGDSNIRFCCKVSILSTKVPF